WGGGVVGSTGGGGTARGCGLVFCSVCCERLNTGSDAYAFVGSVRWVEVTGDGLPVGDVNAVSGLHSLSL
ncbi:hypothetical protein, partial [Salmonella enterica]|uniref:hypothetical protein n=1 Tax=Salmonella enterica TaxID=28901 RepID=UPI00398C50E4